jgi:signal transduction histidine kinase
VAAIVVVLTGAAVWVVVDAQNREADTQLTAAVTRADDVEDPPANVWLTMRSASGTETTRGAPAGVPDLAALDATAATGVTTTRNVTLEDREVRVQTRTTTVRDEPVVVQAVLDLTINHAERARLLTALVAVGALGLALAVAVGAWLGTRAVTPLAEALATQRRFVADAGHELRTPLTLLSTRAQLLHRRLRRPGADPGAATAEAAAVVADSAHLAAILDDLLLSVTPGGPGAASVPVDLGEVSDTVLAAAAGAADRAGVALVGPVHGPRPTTVDGSATALRRAVTALVDNAVRHARSRVEVALTRERDQIHLEVRDDGHGVAPTAVPIMFDRFATSRTDSPEEDDRPRRYGLGLALVAEVAAAHGGSVSLVDGSPGDGAVLRLTLPLAHA